jgi:hypothetical protein
MNAASDPVHHRPVDHDIDLVQAVLQHGDADRCPQEHERQVLEHGEEGPRGNDRRDERDDDEHSARHEPLELQALIPD